MKKSLVIIAVGFLCFAAFGQNPAAGVTNLTDIISQIDESATNMFSPSEVEIRLGGVYVQAQNKAATLIAAEYWLKNNIGFGGEVISLSTKTAAVFPYVGYRKIFGNTAGVVFVGGGYDYDANSGFGVGGLRLEHRMNKHVGVWASVSYEIQFNSGKNNDRGIISGAGLSYAF